MSTSDPVQPDPPGLGAMPPMAPPVSPAPVEAESRWPTVVGVLAITLGALGLVGYGCMGTGSQLMMFMIPADALEQMPEGQRAQIDIAKQYLAVNLTSGCISAVLAILLLVAGIGVVRRRPWGVKSLLAWAGLKMAWTIPALAMSWYVNGKMVEAIQQSGDPSMQGFLGFMQSMGILGTACMFLWAWAFPVFVLIWCLRAPVKAEVAAWGREQVI